jgi:hypothetical protein
MAITRTAIFDDSGGGLDGTVLSNAWKTELYDQIDALINYSTGTWTVTITGGTVAGTQTYSSQVGTYTKIGRLVFVTATVALTAKTLTGLVKLGGLPFACAVGPETGIAIGYYANLLTNWVWLTGHLVPSTTYAYLVGQKAAAATISYADGATDIGATTDLRFSAIYQATF